MEVGRRTIRQIGASRAVIRARHGSCLTAALRHREAHAGLAVVDGPDHAVLRNNHDVSKIEVVSSLTARRLLYQVDRADGFTGKTAQIDGAIGGAGAVEVVEIHIVLVLCGPVGVATIRKGYLQTAMLGGGTMLLHEIEAITVLDHVAALQSRNRRKLGQRILPAVGAGGGSAQQQAIVIAVGATDSPVTHIYKVTPIGAAVVLGQRLGTQI